MGRTVSCACGRQIASKKGSPATALRVVTAVKWQHFDIVRKESEGTLLWLEDAADLESAKARIQELASVWPGEFDVMDQQAHQILAKVIAPSDAQSRKS
jgi:hypothetical protein